MSQARSTNLQPPCVQGVLTPPVRIFYGKHGFKKNKKLLHYVMASDGRGCMGGGREYCKKADYFAQHMSQRFGPQLVR